MAQALSEADAAAVRELIEKSNLASIEVYELSARRISVPSDTEESGETPTGRFNVEVQQRFTATGFGVRLNGQLMMPIGEAVVSMAAEYELEEGYTPSRRVIQMFTNEVGVMTLFPYFREGVSSITSRVFGEPIYIPIAERGQIAVDVEPEVGEQ